MISFTGKKRDAGEVEAKSAALPGGVLFACILIIAVVVGCNNKNKVTPSPTPSVKPSVTTMQTAVQEPLEKSK